MEFKGRPYISPGQIRALMQDGARQIREPKPGVYETVLDSYQLHDEITFVVVRPPFTPRSRANVYVTSLENASNVDAILNQLSLFYNREIHDLPDISTAIRDLNYMTRRPPASSYSAPKRRR